MVSMFMFEFVRELVKCYVGYLEEISIAEICLCREGGDKGIIPECTLSLTIARIMHETIGITAIQINQLLKVPLGI